MKIRILKPCDGMTWNELGQLLRDARYRVFRLANLTVSEAYLNFHLWRTGRSQEFKKQTIGQLNRQLRNILQQEKYDDEKLNRYSKTGALPDTVCSALWQYKLMAVMKKSKWSEVIRGKSSLPTFRNDMAIPVRCDKPEQKRIEKTEQGQVEAALQVCVQPYPRVILGTHTLGDGQDAILKRLLDNQNQAIGGYRQRSFEIKYDEQKRWWLFITYDFPATEVATDKTIAVGVDLGVSVPLYAAVNNGPARLGRREFGGLGRRIRDLRNQTDARRRSIQRSGREGQSDDTARAGHGRKRKLLPIHILEGRLDKAYTTLNHQMSAAVIKFAAEQGAGIIQIENLAGLQDELRGTFIGGRWRYRQLQDFLKYKTQEMGIELRQVNPKYTSRRCSKCGFIHKDFDRDYRNRHSENGKPAQFVCPNPDCKYESDPDYNAARNLATLDIEEQIRVQCQKQGLEYDSKKDKNAL